MIDVIIVSLYFGLWATYMLSITKMLHIMQLEGYKTKDFINWITKNYKVAFKPGITQLLIILAVYSLIILLKVIFIKLKYADIILLSNIEFLLTMAAFYGLNGYLIYKQNKEIKAAKKPLVYTARVKRLIFSNVIILILLVASFIDKIENTVIIFSIFIATIPVNMLLANWFISPTEDMINNHYINSAKRKINGKKYKNLIKIGITGSYGKTSTKFILETILSEKYNVLVTPESYNTTMGNVRTIREKLSPEHQIFISEMGARNKRDIQEICNFVKPKIGIITSIGPQHLETFKTIENVIKTKNELLESLPQDAVVVLPKDNKYCYNLYKEEKHEKYLYSIKEQGADVYIKSITLGEKGSTFVVGYKDGEFECTTKLLGEHNVENILGCITIALHLGLTKEEIVKGVSKIEPIPHRLQILPSNNGTIVIDDAFNSNPVGSKMALDILKKFKGRKIIITPGMVELGKEEHKYNKEFGRHMAKCVDIAILVGKKRTEPIVEGLREEKFEDINIHIVQDLTAATKKLTELSKKGDIVLFENDLPDNYNE